MMVVFHERNCWFHGSTFSVCDGMALVSGVGRLTHDGGALNLYEAAVPDAEA
ncbi:hypothetical protein MKK75_32030 [Methylobacterium sp. J-030]|uniref:hypothetical protein n=1 Tax=Methylobacterium sp. J-030 TaxID=2836627 RepID=UPI001FBC0E09|nr:hypothetical protein [Methylobacterium sp. J-030]MCJ2073363.1 hypothetical protein [Methylobacterium sp. J-030]